MLISAFLVAIAWFTLWYVGTSLVRNASLVDIGWGSGFAMLALFAWLRQPDLPALFLVVPVCVWGIRLSVHIGRRNLGKPEDFRYAAFRRDWGRWYAVRAYFQLFFFQAVMMWIIALPYLTAMDVPEGQPVSFPSSLPSLVLLGFGLLIWLAGIILEVTADEQLRRYMSTPNRAPFLRTGVWKLSRHPNYLGEALLWWGIWLIATAFGAPLYTAVGPAVITALLRWVSGVPMLEKRLATRPGYAEYATAVPIFLPWKFSRTRR